MGTYKANELGKMLADLKKQTERAMADDVARSVYEIVQRFLLQEIYNKSKPEEYQRSYETLRSLKVSPVMNKGNLVSIKIYVPDETYKDDRHKMMYDVKEMGLSEGEMPTVTQVLEMMEEDLARHPQTEIMEGVNQELKSTQIILKRLLGYLRSRGYKIQ